MGSEHVWPAANETHASSITTARMGNGLLKGFYTTSFMNKPALQEQAREVLENAGANELKGQLTQLALPTASAKVSSGQGVQSTRPVALAKVPTSHGTGTETPAAQRWPSGQMVTWPRLQK
jgi:hypothetical protein